MKTVYNFLRLLAFASVGAFIGKTLFQCWDYYKNPGLYAMTSAPWYLSIQVNGLFTAVIAVVLLVIMRLVKRRMKGRSNDPD